MNRVGEFEKVSFEQFYTGLIDSFGTTWVAAGGEQLKEELQRYWQELALPKRATAGSAGYDFKAPFTFTIEPGKTIEIPTGIRVKIEDGWFLECVPRSSLGFKYRMQLNNTVGVIDSDYYYSNNEGHIFAKITNDSKEGKTLSVERGDSFMQAIFLPYGITVSDDAQAVRNGGMGSTGK